MLGKPTILSTRIVKENVFQSQINLIELDFIQINAVAFDVQHVYDFILFTSQNAVLAVLGHADLHVLKSKPVVCVGIKTKELLELNGWNVVAWKHYAKELAPVLISDFKGKTITFFSGNIRRDTLPDTFKANSIVFNEFTVYETVLSPQKITQTLDGICFYSPSGIMSYLQENTIIDEVCFCIGDTTADTLKGITHQIVVAKQPTVEATLQACVDYYEKSAKN